MLSASVARIEPGERTGHGTQVEEPPAGCEAVTQWGSHLRRAAGGLFTFFFSFRAFRGMR